MTAVLGRGGAAGALWRAAATLAAPALRRHLRRRAARGREDPARLAERFGAAVDRPPGRLFWLHAASVGETLSAVPVLEAMLARDPAIEILVTTGTRTAAALLADRLGLVSPVRIGSGEPSWASAIPPDAKADGGNGIGCAGLAASAPRLRHRFVPLDVPGWVARFLDGWRPDAAAFVESELWPNLIFGAASRGVKLALVNARLSARSAARWERFAPSLARDVLGAFQVVLAQSAADAARLAALGAVGASAPGNLKDAAPPLPADPAALAAVRAALGARPVWLAASTHPGEETLALAAHAMLRQTHPDLLLILVPRHPDRGAGIAAEAPASRRSLGALPGPAEAVHVADTLGELGLFYRVARVALVGGSLVPHGGQNPLEPARLGCPIVLGPHHWNFAEPVARLLAVDGAVALQDASPGGLAAAVDAVLRAPAEAAARAAAASGVATADAALPDRVAEMLLALLPIGVGAR